MEIELLKGLEKYHEDYMGKRKSVVGYNVDGPCVNESGVQRRRCDSMELEGVADQDSTVAGLTNWGLGY